VTNLPLEVTEKMLRQVFPKGKLSIETKKRFVNMNIEYFCPMFIKIGNFYHFYHTCREKVATIIFESVAEADRAFQIAINETLLDQPLIVSPKMRE